MLDSNTVGTIEEIAGTFRLSAVLFAATDLGLFDALPEEGATADDLARTLGAVRLPLNLLLNTLVGMGILIKPAERFLLTSPFAAVLRKGPDSLQERILAFQSQTAHWMGLAALVRGRPTVGPYYEEMIHTAGAGQYLAGVARANGHYPELMLQALSRAVADVHDVLDLGGGHGAFARLVVERRPKARVTIMDLEHSLAYGRQLSASHPDRERLSFVVGDARNLELDGRFDFVMINDLLHYMDGEEKRQVLSRGLKALRPGGLLAVTKLRLDDEITPGWTTLFSLRMFINTHKSWLETDRETVRLLGLAGGRELDLTHLDDYKSLITARR
jgi:SAM-dependent methyltransferase